MNLGWMIKCECAIYQKGKFCFGPLILQMNQSHNWDLLTITRKSSERPICGVIAGPIYDGPTYDDPTYNDNNQTKCFSSRSLLSLPRLLSKCMTDQFRTALARRLKNWVWACLYQLSTRQTRMTVVYKVGHSLYNVHWAYKGCYFSPGEYQAYKTYHLYFKSTASLQSLPRPSKSCGSPDRLIAHNNWIAWPPFVGVKLIQGYFTTKKSFL